MKHKWPQKLLKKLRKKISFTRTPVVPGSKNSGRQRKTDKIQTDNDLFDAEDMESTTSSI